MTAPLLILLAFAGLDGTTSPGFEQVGRLEHGPIAEASGLVASRRHPGVFWVHNDSGNPPALFAVRRDGTLLREYRVNVPNIDWEDLASDDLGQLYIGDIGNNNTRLPLRTIYRLDEPDPAPSHEKAPEPQLLKINRSWHYTFPASGRFDAEGLFIDRGRIVLVAKTFDRREAELYAIPLVAKALLARPAVPQRLGVLPGFVEPATGASLAAGGLRLAVCSDNVARVYGRDTRESDVWTLLGTIPYKADNVEAITWDREDLILASEDRGVYRIDPSAWQRGERPRR